MSNAQRPKAFHFSQPEHDPITFQLGNGGPVFHGVDDIDGLSLMWYVAQMTDEDKATSGLLSFLQRAIEPGDWDTFQLRVTELKMKVSDVSEVASWLLEQYTNRPTKSPSITSNGEQNIGSSSTETSPYQGSTQLSLPLGA